MANRVHLSRPALTALTLVLLAGGIGVSAQVAEPPLAQPTQGTVQAQVEGQPDAAEIPNLDQIRAMVGGRAQGPAGPDSDLKPFAEISKDYEPVVSTADGQSLFKLWVRKKDQQIIAELPRGWERQRHFIAMTVSGGDIWAGLQGADRYVYWKRFDNRMALIEPNTSTRSSGDAESKASVNNIFTDRVLVDVPILAIGPTGQPVIDMDALLVGEGSRFFGSAMAGANARLATVRKAKAFPENVEIEFEVPVAGGTLKRFHYSLSLIKDNTGYKPREADQRVGYFTTAYRDLGKFQQDEKWIRYVNRWNLEKRDPSRKLSPPKEPIVFYIEHTVPVRYRRWVRDGVLQWNRAFENVGILDAIEVYYQDEATGAHMDKDPEDVRYNFVRWLSNDISTAIGPSRVHPLTGQILDADIVLTDGWIRVFWNQANEFLPQMAIEGFNPDQLAWIEQNPSWDPRLRFVSKAEQDRMLFERAQRGVLAYGGHPAANGDPAMYGDDEFDGLVGTNIQKNGFCMAAVGKAFDMALMRMQFELESAEETMSQPGKSVDDLPPEVRELIKARIAAAKAEGKELPPEVLAMLGVDAQPETDPQEEPKVAAEDKRAPSKKKSDEDMLDGIPESFIGPALAELVAHEVGHTLGLRHNFKASSIASMAEINSEEFKGKKSWVGSVMDYTPVNVNMEDGEIQGDYSPIDIGPYDMWAIEFGYGFGDYKKVLSRVAEPELVFATDEDTWSSDPLARRYDLGSDPLQFANSRMRLTKKQREEILTKFVKDGDSWSKARRGYNITLGTQTQMLSMMSNWIGGSFLYRDKKGDPNGRDPIVPVPAERQRAALRFVIDNAFMDDAFGLTPELLTKMSVDKWIDGSAGASMFEDPPFAFHDRIMAVQASVLTMVMNPVTLQRVYDNEQRVTSDQDMITLPEILATVSDSIWTELSKGATGTYTPRSPMISSLRRNLQREHVERLIDLSMPGSISTAASRTISTLAAARLRELASATEKLAKDSGSKLDPYTAAHLSEINLRITKALDAQYIYNADKIGGGAPRTIIIGQEARPAGGK